MAVYIFLISINRYALFRDYKSADKVCFTNDKMILATIHLVYKVAIRLSTNRIVK